MSDAESGTESDTEKRTLIYNLVDIIILWALRLYVWSFRLYILAAGIILSSNLNVA